MDKILDERSCVPVSLHAPFLSNLNVLGNIMLVSDVHKHFMRHHSDESGLELLRRLGLESMALMHHTKLGRHKLFMAQLVRAVQSGAHGILIDRPFMMVPSEHGISFIVEAMEKLEIAPERVLIIDQRSNEYKYKDQSCNIKKW